MQTHPPLLLIDVLLRVLASRKPTGQQVRGVHSIVRFQTALIRSTSLGLRLANL